MKTRQLLAAIAAALFIASGSLAAGRETSPWPRAPRAAAGAPNIVVVLLDDVGFGAAATFGGPIATPALDKLASEGLRYNRFHTTALCSPTRASLLSGRNHHRTSFGTVTEIGNSHPGYNSFWPKSVATLPEMLKRNGYSTSAFGKWHNTPLWEVSPVGPFDRWPTGLGFEYFYGFMAAENSQWNPMLYRNTIPVEPGKTPEAGYHFTTDIVDDAIQWVDTHESLAPDKPYFLYFAPGATHAPLHVPKEWIDKYRGRFDQGWDALREETFVRQKTLGVIPGNTELTPRPPQLPAWSDLSADQKRLYARQAEVYAAFLAHTDHEIGRLLGKIRQSPKGDNTLVIYIVGDNGGSAEGGPSGSDHELATLLGLPRSVSEQLAGIDTLGGPQHNNIHAAAWSWAFNAPFQWTKQVASHLGGIRNPMVVSWPAMFKGGGELRGQFTHVNDIAPTLYDVLGIRFPKVVDGVRQEPIDGTSFARSFTDPQAPSGHRLQYFEQLGNRGLYEDGWLASAFHAVPWDTHRSDDYEKDVWELYHLDSDFSQSRNVADRYPQKLDRLKKKFETEARKNKVYPLNNSISAKNLSGGGQPSLTAGRTDFTFYGNAPRLPATVAPPFNGSHRLSARIEVPADGAAGVIVANGGRGGGYVLYVKDGLLTYENNFFGRERTVLKSSHPLPAGQIEVAFDLARQDKVPWGGGTGRLFINGDLVGEGPIPHSGIVGLDSFDLGIDRGSPVSDAYAAPATFTGKVDKVNIRLR